MTKKKRRGIPYACPVCGGETQVDQTNQFTTGSYAGYTKRWRSCPLCAHRFRTIAPRGGLETIYTGQRRPYTTSSAPRSCPDCRHLPVCRSLPPTALVKCETLLDWEPGLELDTGELTLWLPIIPEKSYADWRLS